VLALYHLLLKLKSEGKERISDPIGETLTGAERLLRERGIPFPPFAGGQLKS
jgi:hypothetical protein